MRLATKTAIFCKTYVLGGLLVGGLALALLPEGFGISLLLLWLLGFGVVQFALLRCPHCGKLAIKTPRGAYVPWTGTRCRYCGGVY